MIPVTAEKFAVVMSVGCRQVWLCVHVYLFIYHTIELAAL